MRYSPLDNRTPMTLPFVHPPTDDVLAKHQKQVDACRGRACFHELSRAFGATSPHELEVLVDGYEPRVDADNRKIWSGKYRKWLKGAMPSDETIQRAEERSGGECNLKYWRELPLWALLSEPLTLSPAELHDILVSRPAAIRKILFFTSSPNTFGRYVRHDLSRQELLQLRDMATLDAFIACLALAREGEISNNDQRHSVPAICAFEMFAPVLLSQPHLNAGWEYLYDCLELAFWSRLYVDGVRPDFSKGKIGTHLKALTINPSARCEIWAGRNTPLTDSEREEAVGDLLLGIPIGKSGRE